MWLEHKNYSEMGRILGCSSNAVMKRMKKLGIYERVLRFTK
jgi:DNA-directed RNA polymerase specialized sigma24 family protein